MANIDGTNRDDINARGGNDGVDGARGNDTINRGSGGFGIEWPPWGPPQG
jgi:hypothetical protein